MPQAIVNLAPMTELEAVNAMLSAIGEAPLPAGTDLSVATQADVLMALNLLRNTTRDVQSMGWRFNTEHGYQLAPAATYSWVDTASVTTLLNIFTPPANLIRFTVTKTADQQLPDVDTVLRPSRKYTPGTLVFYDRILNRDGFPQTERPYLYIEPVWAFDFEKMPEEARRYCAISAARQFAQQAKGSQMLSSFTERDEMLALRNLKREFGEEDDYNMLQNTDVSKHLGLRPRWGGAVTIDPRRKNANSV